MARAVIAPRIRGFICTTAHPAGCARNIEKQIEVAQAARTTLPKQYRVLVVGSSTGYGLAARVAATWGYDADTIGVFFERPPDGKKTATAGFYNTAAFHDRALADGRTSININGDAFSHEIKHQAIDIIKETFGQVDLVIYSLASPRRTDPYTGEVYQSVLKPIGGSYTGKTIDLREEVITEIKMDPATEEEISGTIGVMGGDDLCLWTEALLAADALAKGAHVVPFSYIGPELTWPIYRSGTIGKAKEDLETTTSGLNALLHSSISGQAHISINKAVVTQASSAIPVVPLYISLLYRLMKEQDIHEDPIHQMVRLFNDHIGPGAQPKLDDQHRIRLDGPELEPTLQSKINRLWDQVTTENFRELSDYDGFKRGFRQLFGFEVDGVDYEEPVEIDTVV
ncbi:uncharacterized protein METZ01_LOCUS142698 [marine metagenome]|uniref:trans-2-enoyl-CoA reductase (NAD(+)) n=1 Tax=marine metagenome TaxID=408172 RepID=A0A381ZL31_9ZZZZ